MANSAHGEGARARLPLGEMLIALGVLALAGVVFWQTLAIPVSPLYARVGPTVIPMLAAFGLAACGAALLVWQLGMRVPPVADTLPEVAAAGTHQIARGALQVEGAVQ